MFSWRGLEGSRALVQVLDARCGAGILRQHKHIRTARSWPRSFAFGIRRNAATPFVPLTGGSYLRTRRSGRGHLARSQKKLLRPSSNVNYIHSRKKLRRGRGSACFCDRLSRAAALKKLARQMGWRASPELQSSSERQVGGNQNAPDRACVAPGFTERIRRNRRRAGRRCRIVRA
jgi:hypothetical protein